MGPCVYRQYQPHLMLLACNWHCSLPWKIIILQSTSYLGHRAGDKSHGPSDSLDEKAEENYPITLVNAMGDLCQVCYNTEIFKTRCCVRHLASAAKGDTQCQRNIPGREMISLLTVNIKYAPSMPDLNNHHSIYSQYAVYFHIMILRVLLKCILKLLWTLTKLIK